MVVNNLTTLKKDNIECYTLPYGVEPILQYIPVDKVIGCPTDTEDSHFVKMLRAKGNKVIASHIDTGQDCLIGEPAEHGDMIITNPPFKNKTKFMERFMSFDKPFAILLPWGAMGDNGVPNLFIKQNKQLEMLVPKQRMEFGNQKQAGISFKSIYVCYKVLPQQVINCELNIPQEIIDRKKEHSKGSKDNKKQIIKDRIKSLQSQINKLVEKL